MRSLIECVPNFSEGRNLSVIDKLVAAATSVKGAALLDYSADKDHNRSVFTLIAEPSAIFDVAFSLAKTAVENIDLTKHTGGHPRMGAVDVIPFIPVKNSSIAECIEISHRVAKKISKELSVPCFLYEYSAKNSERAALENIRRGQFEGMPKKLAMPEWAPDYGGGHIHPTAGVTAIGARMPLIAYNINLATSDIKVANAISKAVRGSNGGLRHCKAMGVSLNERNIVQVSMNITDYKKTPLYRVFELVRLEAARYGVSVIGSEIIGLAPSAALFDCADYFLRLKDFDSNARVIENRLQHPIAIST